MSGQRVLLVEDEPGLAEAVGQALTEEGYIVDIAGTLAEATAKRAEGDPKLVILDLRLPDGDGLDWLAEIRPDSDLPILLLTAKASVEDRVKGLDLGADDYVTKPFKLEELLARVRALLRRTDGRVKATIQVGGLTIEMFERRVTLDGRLVFLSNTEYAVLELLANSAGKPVSKAQILERVWDDSVRPANVVEVYISYIRSKLERGGAPRLIHTLRGQGYLLAERETS